MFVLVQPSHVIALWGWSFCIGRRLFLGLGCPASGLHLQGQAPVGRGLTEIEALEDWSTCLVDVWAQAQIVPHPSRPSDTNTRALLEELVAGWMG